MAESDSETLRLQSNDRDGTGRAKSNPRPHTRSASDARGNETEGDMDTDNDTQPITLTNPMRPKSHSTEAIDSDPDAIPNDVPRATSSASESDAKSPRRMYQKRKTYRTLLRDRKRAESVDVVPTNSITPSVDEKRRRKKGRSQTRDDIGVMQMDDDMDNLDLDDGGYDTDPIGGMMRKKGTNKGKRKNKQNKKGKSNDGKKKKKRKQRQNHSVGPTLPRVKSGKEHKPITRKKSPDLKPQTVPAGIEIEASPGLFGQRATEMVPHVSEINSDISNGYDTDGYGGGRESTPSTTGTDSGGLGVGRHSHHYSTSAMSDSDTGSVIVNGGNLNPNQYVPPLHTGKSASSDSEYDGPSVPKIQSLNPEKIARRRKGKRPKSERPGGRGKNRSDMGFEKAKIRPSSATLRKTQSADPANRSRHRRDISEISDNGVTEKYKGHRTPATPVWRELGKYKHLQGDAKSDKKIEALRKEFEQTESQLKKDYERNQRVHRAVKKDLKKLQQEDKAISTKRRRLKKDMAKLERDREELEAGQRALSFRRDRASSAAKRKDEFEEEKLRKMLFEERKGWKESEKNYKAEIMRLNGLLGELRNGNRREKIDNYKQEILSEIGSMNYQLSDGGKRTGATVHPKPGSGWNGSFDDWRKQQRELQRFMKIEKNKAMGDLEIQRKKLEIMAKQLRAEKNNLESGKATFRNARHRRGNQNSDTKVLVDTRVKKIYVNRKPGKVIRKQGDVVHYRPKEVRFVYRNLRKNVYLRTHDWDTRIKYLNGRGKELKIIKNKIQIMEDKIERKRHKRKKKKKKKFPGRKKIGTEEEERKKKKKKKKKKGQGNVVSDSENEESTARRRKKKVRIESESNLLDDPLGSDDPEYATSESESESDSDLETEYQPDSNEPEEQADPEYAKILEELEKLQRDYAKVQSEIDQACEAMHSDVEGLKSMNMAMSNKGDFSDSSIFEKELAKLERQLSGPHDFAKSMRKLENVVSEKAEAGGMLREVVDSLSERLAAAQLEIDGLKEQLRKAKRRQELRQLYQKMAYSDMPAYQKLQSQHLHMNRNMQHMPLQSGQTTPNGMSPASPASFKSETGEIQMLDEDGKPVMRLQDAIGVVLEPDDYSPSGIVKGCKSVYASGLIGDQLDVMHDRGVVPALLDIIKKNGRLRQNPENELVVNAALQALAPLLDDPKLRKQFMREDGIDIFDDLYGPNMEALDHMYPVSGRIAECVGKIAGHASESDQQKIGDLALKICRVTKDNIDEKDGLELVHDFGDLLSQIPEEYQRNLSPLLTKGGLPDIAANCALKNGDDYAGVRDTFGFCHDRLDDSRSFLKDNKLVPIRQLIEAVNSYAQDPDRTEDVFTHVLDGLSSMITRDPMGEQMVNQFIDQGLEPVLLRAVDKAVKDVNEANMEMKYEEDDESANLSPRPMQSAKDKAMLQAIGDFYNTLSYERMDPKMEKLKRKLEELNVPIYGTDEWVQRQRPTIDIHVSPRSPDGQLLEDLFSGAHMEEDFDENDALEASRNRRNGRMNHPSLTDIAEFLSRAGRQRKDTSQEQKLQALKLMVQQRRENGKKASKMSKMFKGVFHRKKTKDKMEMQHEPISNNNNNMLLVPGTSPSLSPWDGNTHHLAPNRLQQQNKYFLEKMDLNGRKRVPKYDDFMNEAFNQKLGKGLNEVQQIYNEMTHHTGMVKPVGSMLQKWYVLSNHSTTYWISPSNKDLEKYTEEHDAYYDMEEEEKFHDCWLLFDMKRKRLVQELRWRNRGMMNDPKYIEVQAARNEETPWVSVQKAYLENTEQEQVVDIGKKARYWRILFLGNYGEDTEDAPRFVFSEVQFWGRRHSTMANSMARQRSHDPARQIEESVSAQPLNQRAKTQPPSVNVGSKFGQNTKRGQKYRVKSMGGTPVTIEMTGKSKFNAVPSTK